MIVIALCGAVTSCSGSPTAEAAARTLTVLELGSTSGSWTGLDPLTNLAASINHDFFNAIYGQLFRRATSGRIVGDLAAGYAIDRSGRRVDLMLRPGVRFSDGTPMDAEAVAFNLRRDLDPNGGCRCLANFSEVASVSVRSASQVTMHLRTPDPAIMEAFLDAAPNWMVSPTSLRRLGVTAFALTPVGAGPFTVLSDDLNSSLALKANPHYWRHGFPKVDRLTFTSIADDTTAYAAMRTGQAQIYMAFGTPALLSQMRERFDTVPVPASQTEAINLNPQGSPFDEPRAREALYYATDPQAINELVFKNAGVVSQSPGGPADLYWHALVRGYRAYDPDRARSIVGELGGLSFTLSALNTPIQLAVVEALQSQWAKVGIRATIELISIPQAVEKSHAGTLQAIATQVGTYNPALIPGLAASYSSSGPFSLVRDERLDALIQRAVAARTPAGADAMYRRVYEALSESAYAPFLFTMNQWNVAARSVHGLSASDVEVDWESVSTQ